MCLDIVIWLLCRFLKLKFAIYKRYSTSEILWQDIIFPGRVKSISRVQRYWRNKGIPFYLRKGRDALTLLRKTLQHKKYLSQGISIFNKIIVLSHKDVFFVYNWYPSPPISMKIKILWIFECYYFGLKGILVDSIFVEKILFITGWTATFKPTPLSHL